MEFTIESLSWDRRWVPARAEVVVVSPTARARVEWDRPFRPRLLSVNPPEEEAAFRAALGEIEDALKAQFSANPFSL